MAADSKRPVDAVTGTETTGHEWDGIRELNTPLPRWWLWLFYITHRLVDRILDRLSGLAAAHQQYAGRAGWNSRARHRHRPRRPARAARRDGRARSRPPRSRKSSPTRSCWISPALRAAPPSPTIARLATAPAAAAPRATPTSTTTTGCGAASSTTSPSPSGTASARPTTRPRPGSMPAFGRDKIAGAAGHSRGRRLHPLALRPAGGGRRRSRARQEGLRRELRRLPRRQRQGQSRDRRAQPDRPDLALRARQGRRSSKD